MKHLKPDPPKRVAYGIKDAAIAYSVSPGFLRQRVTTGEIPAKLFRRRVLILASDLEKYFNKLEDYRPRKELNGIGSANLPG